MGLKQVLDLPICHKDVSLAVWIAPVAYLGVWRECTSPKT